MSKKAKSKKVNNVETVQTVDVNALIEELASLKAQLSEKDETIQQLTLLKNAKDTGCSHHNKTNFLQYVSLFQFMTVEEINGEKFGVIKNENMRQHGFKLAQYTRHFGDIFSRSYQFTSLSFWLGAFNLKVVRMATVDGVQTAYVQPCQSKYFLDTIQDKIDRGLKTWTPKLMDRAVSMANTIVTDDQLKVETPFGTETIEIDRWIELFNEYVEKHQLMAKCEKHIKLHD